jgi:hypothetical protein
MPQVNSPGTLVSSINKADRHDISEILFLKVALNPTSTFVSMMNLSGKPLDMA